MADFTPTLTEAQACDVVYRGVVREIKQDSQRTLAYCKDAVNLRGFNVRKLAQKCEIRAEEKGETFNADSYQSNVSNANGVMGLFDYDLELFEAWLKDSPTKSLSAIFKSFRELFVAPKPAKPKAPKTEGESADDEPADPTPLIDVVLSAIPMLSAEERLLVKFLLDELDVAEHTPTETEVAA